MVCRISEAAKGSRGCARLAGIFLVEDSETISIVLVDVVECSSVKRMKKI